MHRIHVQKQEGHDHEARKWFYDLKENLSLAPLTGLRIAQRYDIDGIDERQLQDAASHILSEPQVDEVFPQLVIDQGETAFALEYLPGQFDQRADSAAQCIQILTGGKKPTVFSSRIFVLKGALNQSQLESIKEYVINTVDSHEVPVDGLIARKAAVAPSEVKVLAGFAEADPAEVRSQYGLAMSEEDVVFCQKYFGDQESRDPTITELKMLDTYWSDHCRHTTFLTSIDRVEIEDADGPVAETWEEYQRVRRNLGREQKPVTLMDIALIGMRELRESGELDNVEVSDEVNAASIVVPVSIDDGPEEEWLVMFKNETHNHPTEIEPFGGAATCLGGCIRDPLSGRSYVYQAMRVTGAGDPLQPFSETLPGKLPQKKICQVAAHGYSSYGNQIGLATGQVSEVYHPGYVAKRLEIGAVVAAVPRSQVFRGSPAAGDVIMLIGGRTGRDGVGGATGSSKQHDDTALENSAEVQKGDAPTERKIQRLFRNPELTRKIKICNDFGAGGVSVAIGEIAPSLLIDLDQVPKKYEGLDGTELAISESQERMAICIDPSEADYFVKAADVENLECVKVADVTDTGRLVMTWRGKTIVDLSRNFLDTNGVQQTAQVRVPKTFNPFPEPAEIELPKQLALLENCSRRGLGEMFDASVGASTVLWPFGGANQITPPDAMVAKLPLIEGNTESCTHMAWGFDPVLSAVSPFHGAVYAVTESVCKIVASGGRLSDIRLTLQEYFPKLGNDPSRWGLPFAALLGAFHAQHKLRLGAIGGKDSMSGSFNELDVPPTLVSFALAPGKASRSLSPEFKQPDSLVSILKIPRDENNLPDFESLAEYSGILHRLNQEGRLLSLHHVGRPSIQVAIAKCCFGNGIGFEWNSHLDAPCNNQENYFSFLIESSEQNAESLREELQGLETIGRTTAAPVLQLKDRVFEVSELQSTWEQTLEPVYPTRPPLGEETLSMMGSTFSTATSSTAFHRHPEPKVLIPAFPGTNSEYDSAKAFQEAGGESEILVFRNQSAAQVDESLRALAQKIRESQILMFPGGFSAGDEPDGSAKFIATVIRNPRIADAIMHLIKERDGLVLGICNGFQALIKTGLVPYGEIRESRADSPTLVHNTIGRHISRYAQTRITSTLSPWFSSCSTGDLHTVPLSHGEGRFFASAEVVSSLSETGQIATQYVDREGAPSMSIAHNPNGSIAAIEGITSPCGRVLGKMGHTERAGEMVARNIPGNKIQPIFAAGVDYFRG